MLTDDQIERWDLVTEAATSGPWEIVDATAAVDPSDHIYAIARRQEDIDRHETVAFAVHDCAEPHTVASCISIARRDAVFIAAAREAVPALIAEVRRLRGRVLQPLTETEVVAALHEGHAESRAAQGDHAWTTILRQRDCLRALLDEALMELEDTGGEFAARRAAEIRTLALAGL